MDQIRGQFGIVGMEDDGEAEYQVFTDKFKPKKTTDDCYTPDNVYEAVLGWAVEEYGIPREKVVRPFWPGGDYEAMDYPEGCVVVDNPPFSILTKIQRFYQKRKIPFLLFAPALTVITPDEGVTAICTDAAITYANGAVVNTSFRTNLSPDIALRTAPELNRRIVEADKANQPPAPKLPRYEYPSHVVSVALMQRLATRGVAYTLRRKDCAFIRRMDAQVSADKAIFGGGFLLSDSAAAAAAAPTPPTVWELSQREKNIVRNLGGGSADA